MLAQCSLADYAHQVATRLTPDEEARQNLLERIAFAYETSKFDDKDEQFLPTERLGELISMDVIRNVLGLTDNNPFSKPETEQLIGWIHDNAARVFAITILCNVSREGAIASMINFLRPTVNFKDSDLPIPNPRLTSPPTTPTYFQDVKRFWNLTQIGQFYDTQWKFLAPIFRPGVYEYDLEPDCILPFTRKDKLTRVGGFSNVYKVHIHAKHCQMDGIGEVRQCRFQLLVRSILTTSSSSL